MVRERMFAIRHGPIPTCFSVLLPRHQRCMDHVRNAAGKAQHLVVNHRPRSSVMLFARVMGKKYAGTPLAKYFITDES